MHKGEIINSARLTFRFASRWQKRGFGPGARGQKYHIYTGLALCLSFSTYRSLALAFFDERESEREGRRKESQKHTTQFTFIVPEDGRKSISSLSQLAKYGTRCVIAPTFFSLCH